jgi:hypothetical protein
MSKLKKALGINPDNVRIREFELGGQKFRVRVPLTTEAEAMYSKTANPDPAIVEAKYQEIAKPLIELKDKLTDDSKDIVFTDNDIIVKEKSMREMAMSQATTQQRILETFKLLVPIDGTSMDDLTYEDINTEFPLPIQLTIVKKITEIISPGYEDSKKN